MAENTGTMLLQPTDSEKGISDGVLATSSFGAKSKLGRFVRAAVLLAVAAAPNPRAAADDITRLDEALAALRAGQFAVADRAFAALLDAQETPESVETLYLAAQAASANGYYRRALALTERYLAHDGASLLYRAEAIALKRELEAASAAQNQSDAAAFDYAQTRGSIPAYAAYRRAYPEGRFLRAADLLSFERAKELNAETSYLRYLEHWPDGGFVTDAKRSADRAAFREARRLNQISSYQQYLEVYPGGTFAAQAIQRMEALAFFRARKDGSVTAIKDFLARFPDGGYAAEARLALESAQNNVLLRTLSGPTTPIPPGALLVRRPAAQGTLRRSVTIPINNRFRAMAHEVTFAMWQSCVDDGGCGGTVPEDMGWGRDRRPVINVSWTEVQDYIAWMSRRWQDSGGTGTWRLPTEHEWTYMARGLVGRQISPRQAFNEQQGACPGCDCLPDPDATFPAASFPPNSFGLYDMLGNVAEWVGDCWRADPTDLSAAAEADSACDTAVIKGPSGNSNPSFVATQARQPGPKNQRFRNVGFRLILVQ